jgi:23S rRNA (guanosine2251-2'-O)-methyltransferase
MTSRHTAFFMHRNYNRADLRLYHRGGTPQAPHYNARTLPASTFQIRECTNPECGMRYPQLRNSSPGDRCPNCLGATRLVIEQELRDRQRQQSVRPEAGTRRLEALLDNVRSALNVGSVFRSADGFGIGHLYLCGFTPTPANRGVLRASLGAEQSVRWSQHKNALRLCQELMSDGAQIVVLEDTPSSITLDHFLRLVPHPQCSVLVIGNEITGVDPGILAIGSPIVRLPMVGTKRSFNAAAAFAVAAYALRSR